MRARLAVALTCIAIASAGSMATALAQPVQWEHRFPQMVSLRVASLAADGTGNVYFMNVGGGYDAHVTKLNASGSIAWNRLLSLDWPACGSCSRAFLDLDAVPSGVYVLGAGSRGPMACPIGCGTFNVYELDPADGTQTLLYALYSAPVTSVLSDVAAAPSGAMVTAGYDATSGLLVRTGPAAFEIRFGQQFERVAVTGSGAIVATAVDAGAPLLRRYDAAGVLQWSLPIGSACSTLAVDASERVACMTTGGPIVVDSSGIVVWGPVPVDAVTSMAFDPSGSLWVAGRSGCAVGLCATLVKLGDGGAVVARDTIVDVTRSGEWRALAIGPTGDVYVTGLSRPFPASTFPPSDMITARYTNDGLRQWLVTYSGAGNWNDFGDAIVATSDGAIVGGTVHDTAATSLAVIKYGATVIAAGGGPAQEVPLLHAPLVALLSLAIAAIRARMRFAPA